MKFIELNKEVQSMKIKIINTPQLFCEDFNGDFIGVFEEGDSVKVKLNNAKEIKGVLDDIFGDTIELVTDDDFITIKLEDIEEIN